MYTFKPVLVFGSVYSDKLNLNCIAMNEKENSFIPLTPPGGMKRSAANCHIHNWDDDVEDDNDLVICGDVAPWTKSSKFYVEGVVGLHQEIEDFYKYLSPNPESHTIRLQVFFRLKSVVNSLWPDAGVETFGSFATGLYLPTSDLDVVIFGKWEAFPFRTLENRLFDISVHQSIDIIDSATVPIVRYTDKVTNIKVDISFNSICGPKSAQIIKLFKKKFPVLPKLVTVLKQFLYKRDLCTVYTGGLSSYSLTLMVISFLQLHVRTDTERDSSQTNLGVLLLEFFHHYGQRFNYDCLAISVREGGKYFDKWELSQPANIHKRWTDVSNIAVEHCLEPWKDAARGTYNIQVIRRAFAFGYRKLVEGLRRDKSETKGILQLIIKV